MAYNPFDFFRRNQKLFFAGLTVLVMVMFVLSFGQGDFFSLFPQWLSKWQSSGEVMATIGGSKVKESHLREVNAERNLANGYMNQLAGQSLASAFKAAQVELAGASPDLKQRLEQSVNTAASVLGRMMTAEEQVAIRLFLAGEADGLAKLAENTPKSDDKKRVNAVRTFVVAALGEVARRTVGDRGEGGVYFANQPNSTDRDRLEFLLWKKKADKLGIRYTNEDVAALVAQDFPTAFTADEVKRLANDTAAKAGKKTSELWETLADEFRVRAAQTAVLGVSEVRMQGRVPAGTPEERYQHFVKETTATKYTFFAIPVEAYLTQVTGEPTEAELTEIFNKRGNTDPDPASPNPGIREPRKVGVQWVEMSGEEPFYQALAAKRVKEIPAYLGLAGGSAAAAPALTTVGYDQYLADQAKVITYRQTQAANPGRPSVGNIPLTALGSGLMADPNGSPYPQFVSTVKNPADQQDGLLDAEFVRPEIIAAFTGLTTTGFATAAPTLAPMAAVAEAAFRQSRERRVVAGIQAFHFPTLPGLSELATAAGGASAMIAGTPAPLPEKAVQSAIDRRTADQLRTVLATEDVTAFQKELARIVAQKPEIPKGTDRNAQDKLERENRAKVAKEAADYATKWIAERGLKSGGTTEPRSVHQLADDPGLAPLLLKDVVVTDFTGRPKNPRARTAFGTAFVNEQEIQFGGTPDRPQFIPRMRPVNGVYQVREYSPSTFRRSERDEYAPFAPGGFFGGGLRVNPGSPLTMVWRTVEVDPARPLSLTSDKGAAREKCKAIWRMTKARELARKAADEAAKELNKPGVSEVELGRLAADVLAKLQKPFLGTPAAAGFRLFEQAPQFTYAKLLLGPSLAPDAPPELVPFNPTHPAVVYDTEKLPAELIAHKDDPVGTTFVVADQPQTTLFLTVVAARETRDDAGGERMFASYVMNPEPQDRMGAGGLSAAALTPRFAAAALEADRKLVVEMLKAEFGYKGENPNLDSKKE
ncbi:MAG: SurA N-terminal domain-containing protein [Fimbriiglobus sp.]|jgi:hypothetical protein|nr:SurA N-terminal domain-containing protein [Fimbriiglobus sp.]